MRALMLCAGEGRRLRPLTDWVAKPAVPIMNIPMWCYPLHLVESLGISELHVNLHHLPETVKSSFQEHGKTPYPITFHMEKDLLGSAGPLLHLKNLPKNESPILLVNGDGLVLTKDHSVLRKMLDRHHETQALASVLGMPLEGAGERFSALWTDNNHELLGIGTQGIGLDTRPLHYASIMILSPRIFDFVDEHSRNIFNDVLLPAQKKGEKVKVMESADLLFHEVGNPEGLIKAHQSLCTLVQENRSEWNLIDVFDRFQPGWRNFQKNHVFRNKIYSSLRFENNTGQLVLISDGTEDPKEKAEISVLGPSSLYQIRGAFPKSVDGIYWGPLGKCLKNSGELEQI